MNEWLRIVLFLPPQASSVAAEIDHLHYFVILTTFFGATAIALTAAWWTFRFRRRGAEVEKPRREEAVATPAWLEALIVVGIFTLFLAWWLIGYMQYLRVRIAPLGTYDVYVTAKQWMWKFSYADGHHDISQLYVPAGRPVKLIMTSRDVIHSFYVPDFRVKQDVIPGRYTTLWFTALAPGKHLIECAEYCGTNHSTMRGEVIALAPEDFGKWLGSGNASRDPSTPAPPTEEPAVALDFGPSRPMDLARLGQAVAAQEGCLRCHTLDGAPHIGPTWAGLYRSEIPLRGGGTLLADEGYLTESMMDPLARIHLGFPPVMPSYLGLLRPGETAAIVELIKSLRDVPPQKATGVPPPALQAVPLGVDAPPPSQQGLPPPGAPVIPPMNGDVRVGPNGPEGVAP